MHVYLSCADFSKGTINAIEQTNIDVQNLVSINYTIVTRQKICICYVSTRVMI